MKIIQEALTYDDVLLVPAYSTITPAFVNPRLRWNSDIELHAPIFAAAMDSVSEANMAIALAIAGGIAFIHKNMSIEEQAAMVKQVKSVKITYEEHPHACVNEHNQLVVGIAVGVGEDTLTRVKTCVEAGVDMVSVDSAHGHSIGVIDTLKAIKELYPNIELIGGNIISSEAALALKEAGCTAVKVGVGPGSICTTRVVAGVGVPQLSAIMNVAEALKGSGVKIIADGGIKYSGDIVKAIGAGADAVMLGSLLAGCDETPGDLIQVGDKLMKSYVGMGSLKAMKKGSSDRYFQGGVKDLNKLVPEGVESLVPAKGPVSDVIYQMMGGLRSGLGYCGCATLKELQEKAQFVRITNNGLVESHPHDVLIAKEAPNYRGR
jgi:IMP dehydrogenase